MQRHSLIPRIAAALALTLSLGCPGPGPSDSVPEAVIEHNILGTAYLGQQNWADALAAFREALELRPGDPLLLTNAAVALVQQGEIEAAVASLEQALAADPDFPFAHYDLGLIDNQNGEFESAVAHFETVARYDPEDLFTQYYLGTTLSRIAREDDAVAAYRKALELNPAHVSSLYGLGRLLMQRGEEQEGRELIQLSQEIRARSGLDEAVGGQYGEQGPFAMGIDYSGDALAAPAAIAVRYETAHAFDLENQATTLWVATPLENGGEPKLLMATAGRVRLHGQKAPIAPEAPGELRALRAGDVDNDGLVELVGLVGDAVLEPILLDQSEAGKFAWRPDAFSGAVEAQEAADAGLTLVDLDHDGDLDVFWCWSGSQAGCRLGINDGSAGFAVRDSSEHGFDFDGTGSGPVEVAFSDVDNDRDIDLVVAGPDGLGVYFNQRDGTFEDVSDRAGLGAALAGRSMQIADLNKDGWMDLVLGSADGVQLAANRRGRFGEPVRLADGRSPGGTPLRVVVLDFDNDGFLDLARATKDGVSIDRNLGQGNWQALAVAVSYGADPSELEPRAVFDADGDGDLDLVVEGGGEAALLHNEGGNANRWVTLDSRGVGDNKLGVGAKVEVLAGALRQKFEITGPLPLHVGLGQREVVQSARYVWPSGVLQDEVQLASNREVAIEQLDRKGTSCPLLYAWRDGAWRFVTDFLGGSAVGYQLAPGVFSTPDTDEYVRIEGGLDAGDDGRLRLRLHNQLEEVIWYDEVELVAIDHPVGTEVYPNERLMPGPPWPEFRLFASSDVRPVVAARSVENDRDVTARVHELDRVFVDDFRSLAPKGYAKLHTLELDLGPFPRGQRVVLLLDGWIDYADSSANVAAAQAGLELVPPRLQIADGRGGWLEPEHLMGFPAGLPKTMSVELTGLHRTADHRVRLQTNMRIFWDRARVMLGGEATPLEVTRLEPLAAELGFGGFPREATPDGIRPFAYDPEQVDAVSPWKAHAGPYTAYGDVTDLLVEIDDRLVTTKNGDQVVVEFPAPGPPAAGWQRTYLLFADGFGKDMDPNSAASDEVGPLPFHGMPSYPYPAGIVPPAAAVSGEVRRVLRSERGWHGAVPQPLVSPPRTP